MENYMEPMYMLPLHLPSLHFIAIRKYSAIGEDKHSYMGSINWSI